MRDNLGYAEITFPMPVDKCGERLYGSYEVYVPASREGLMPGNSLDNIYTDAKSSRLIQQNSRRMISGNYINQDSYPKLERVSMLSVEQDAWHHH